MGSRLAFSCPGCATFTPRSATRMEDGHGTAAHCRKWRDNLNRPATVLPRRVSGAGLYNMGWGLFTAIDPQGFFRFADVPPQNYPEIFACLGMVIALYGILYLEVARVPERGWLL